MRPAASRLVLAIAILCPTLGAHHIGLPARASLNSLLYSGPLRTQKTAAITAGAREPNAHPTAVTEARYNQLQITDYQLPIT